MKKELKNEDVVKLPHLRAMNVWELERVLFLAMTFAENDVECIHEGKVSNIRNAWERMLVDIGLGLKLYNSRGSQDETKILSPLRAKIPHMTEERIAQQTLDETQYPELIGLYPEIPDHK